MKIRPCQVGLDCAFIACVFSMLLFPIVRLDWKRTVLEKEKRTINPWPDAAQWHELDPQLGRNVEAWLNDRFGGRERCLDFQAQLDLALNGFIRNDNVFSGREGWLFYNQGGSLQGFQHTDLFSRYERQMVRKNLICRSDWLKAMGGRYVVSVSPAKNRVYGEFYPPGIHVMGPQGRADQMVQNLQSNTTVPVVFALDDLLEAKQKGESYLYFQQDTHWTQRGAFIAYQALMRRICQGYPEVGMVEVSDFKWFIQPEVGGDLTPLTRLRSFPWVSHARYDVLEYSQTFSYFQEPIKYPGEEFHTRCPGRPLKVWVFMDSFGFAMYPFLASTFGEAIFVRSHLFNEYQEVLQEYRPDLVIHLVAERLLALLLLDQPPLKPVEEHAF